MTNEHPKSPLFCIPRVLVRVRAHMRSPSQYYDKSENFYKCEDLSVSSGKSIEVHYNNEDSKAEPEGPNRVMVVVDSSLEAKSALRWALSHTVQSQDTIFLLHMVKPNKKGVNCTGENNQRAYELLSSMKNQCQIKRPGVNVEISIQEGKEKGRIIVEEAKQRKVSLLVLGQRKRSVLWRLQMLWAGKQGNNRVVEYCIQHANCMTIAVRRKSKNRGGYLITTKRHKNFWLLA